MISATNEPRKIGDIVLNSEIIDTDGKSYFQPLKIIRESTYGEWREYCLSKDPNHLLELEEDFRYFYEISVD